MTAENSETKRTCDRGEHGVLSMRQAAAHAVQGWGKHQHELFAMLSRPPRWPTTAAVCKGSIRRDQKSATNALV
jgi:hypothetical protein